jgi:flavodoxin
MKTALVVYRSRSGTTRALAEEIGRYLAGKGLEPTVLSIGDCDPARVAEADVVLLGCWTNGLLVILQHPDQPWIAFARDLPSFPNARVGLFTTYKLLTGSMFAKMREHLAGKTGPIGLELKSRNAHLSDANRRGLDRFLSGV